MGWRPAWLGIGTAMVLGSTWFVMGRGETDVITGGVMGPGGPEPGVWVIAETGDLGTKFRKIVVTDDEGRFLLPELPQASYRVWVRGYGLVDSQPVSAVPGQDLALTAAAAPTPQQAASIYPASYWLSLMQPPSAHEFPGTGPRGNGISEDIKTLDEFMFAVKGCLRCHQVGTKWTRETPADDEYAST